MIERFVNTRACTATKWALAAAGLTFFLHGLNNEPNYKSPDEVKLLAEWRIETIAGLGLGLGAASLGLRGMAATNKASRAEFKAMTVQPPMATAAELPSEDQTTQSRIVSVAASTRHLGLVAEFVDDEAVA